MVLYTSGNNRVTRGIANRMYRDGGEVRLNQSEQDHLERNPAMAQELAVHRERMAARTNAAMGNGAIRRDE